MKGKTAAKKKLTTHLVEPNGERLTGISWGEPKAKRVGVLFFLFIFCRKLALHPVHARMGHELRLDRENLFVVVAGFFLPLLWEEPESRKKSDASQLATSTVAADI